MAFRRKIKYISVDDEYNPAEKCRTGTKACRERSSVAAVLLLGTAHNAAIQKYMNAEKVPSFSSDPGVLDGEIEDISVDDGSGSRLTKPKAKLYAKGAF